MFVLYKLSVLQATPWDEGDNDHGDTNLSSTGERLLRLSLEVLLKTQNDDVRLNCVGQCHPFLTAAKTHASLHNDIIICMACINYYIG